jgi:hypothetical protein
MFFTESQRHAVAAFQVGAVDSSSNHESGSALRSVGALRLASVFRLRRWAELIALLGCPPLPRVVPDSPTGQPFRAGEGDRRIESKRNNVVLHVGKASFVYHTTTQDIERSSILCRSLRVYRSTIVNTNGRGAQALERGLSR